MTVLVGERDVGERCRRWPGARSAACWTTCRAFAGRGYYEILRAMTDPELLWTPSPEQVHRATLTRYQAWVEQQARADVGALRGPVALVGGGYRRVLVLDRRVFRPTARRLAVGRARQSRDAWRAVVPGRTGQLRRARFPRQARRRAGDPARLRAAAAVVVDVGRAARADGRDRGGTARAGRVRGRPRRGVHAEHPRDRGRGPGLRVDRCDVVVARRPSSALAA